MMNNVIKISEPKAQVVRRKVLTVLKWLFFGIVLFLLYLPIFVIIVQSVNSSITGSSFAGFTLKWYKKMFEQRDLMEAIYNSISIAVLATLISVVFGTISAIGINGLNKKKRKRMILLNNIPILNADIVTGIFLMLVLQIIQAMLPGVAVFGYWSMLFAHVFFCTPYIILSVLPKLNEVDDNLFDAAMDLGCKPFDALRKVIIPSIKTGIVSGALIAFTMSIDDFVISYMTGSGGVQNFSIWLYSIKNPFRNNAMQMAFAYNTIISLGTLLILVIYNILKSRKKGLKK